MDLNMMMREQALANLNTELDTAVTNGDTEAARKASKKIAELTAATQPKGPPYGDAEIRAELGKQPWFGTDPKKSAKSVEFAKMMDINKFPTAAAFAEAVVKAVDEEFKPPVVAGKKEDGDDEGEGDGAGDPEGGEADAGKGEKKAKKSDGPGDDGLGGARSNAGKGGKGPWTKLSDAPPAVREAVKRQADKFVPQNAKPEVRAKFITDALASHYNHQKGK